MQCTRGHAAAPSKVCELDAQKFFHRKGTLFTFAACPVHVNPPIEGYVEVTEREYREIRSKLEEHNAATRRGQA